MGPRSVKNFCPVNWDKLRLPTITIFFPLNLDSLGIACAL